MGQGGNGLGCGRWLKTRWRLLCIKRPGSAQAPNIIDYGIQELTFPAGEQRKAMATRRLSQRQKRILQWLATDHQRTRGIITSSHQDLVRALPGDKGNISHSLHTLEARGLIVIGRSPGGKAESLWLTPEGQKWASQFTGSCD